MAILRPTATKALGPDATKLDAGPTDATTAYPASAGWRPVHNRLGDRVGFHHPTHGYKDDPAALVNSAAAADAAMKAKVFADPQLQRLEVARQEAETAWTLATEALRAHRRQIDNEVRDSADRQQHWMLNFGHNEPRPETNTARLAGLQGQEAELEQRIADAAARLTTATAAVNAYTSYLFRVEYERA